jgi:P27 family predicted phage terminase small subunit
MAGKESMVEQTAGQTDRSHGADTVMKTYYPNNDRLCCWWCHVARPEKDPALHRLQGTKSVAGKTEVSVKPGRPKFPRNLNAEQRVVFKRIVRLLERRRHITEGDVELIRIYAVTYTRHVKALAKLEEEGEIRTYVRLDSNGTAHDQEKPNLWLKVAETAEKNLVACLDRLGLTPHNRAKVKPTSTDAAKPADPMEEFLSRPRAADLDEEETLQ